MRSTCSYFTFCLTLLCCSAPLQADVISTEFSLGTSDVTAVGNTLLFPQMFTASDGVSFTATLSVVGSDDIDQTGSTLGIAGNGNDLFNGAEFAEFSVAISGVTGGSVVFDGFSQIDLDAFTGTTADPEFAAVSSDSLFDAGDLILDGSLSTSDLFVLPNLTSFFLVSNGDNSNTFRASDVTANFTTTAAVPEPSTWAFSGLLLLGFVGMKRRAAKRQAISDCPCV